MSLSQSPADTHRMSINGDEPPPEEYVVKDPAFGSPDCHSALGELPIIDVSLFSPSPSPNPKALDFELGKLKSAITKEGCFQAVGHGISRSVLERIREIAKEFFELEEEEKMKYSRKAPSYEGYGGDVGVVISEKQLLDWNYRLFLQVFPYHSRNLTLWPQIPNDFREILDEYSEKIKLMMEIIYKAMAKSLNLEEDTFLMKLEWDRSSTNASFNLYPPCSRPDLVLGVKAHTDGSAITVLLQDNEVEGLQVLMDGKWVKVPVIPHALVVNIGDQMQIMSNGIMKSPWHRVVTNSEKMRISLAMFNVPHQDTEIGPLDAFVDQQTPKLYRTIKNYGATNYQSYQKGIVPIDTLKI